MLGGIVGSLLVVNTLVYTAHRGSKVAVALMASDLGAGAALVSGLAALYSLLSMLLAFVSGRWSDRFGVVAPLLLGSALIVLALVVPAVWPSIPALLVCAVLVGAGQVNFHISIQNAFGQLSDDRTRTRHFAAYSLTVACSAMIGPVIATAAIDGVGFTACFGLLGLVALCGTFLIARARASIPVRSSRPPADSGSASSLLRVAPLRKVVMVSAAVTAAYELFGFYLPLHARAEGMSAIAIGYVLAAYGGGAIAVRVALPALVARMGAERLLYACLFSSAAGYLLVPACGDAASLILVSSAIGLALGCGPALLVPMTYERAPRGRAGEALGIRLSAAYGAHTMVPIALGSLGAFAGLAAIFWANGALLACAGLYLARKERSALSDA